MRTIIATVTMKGMDLSDMAFSWCLGAEALPDLLTGIYIGVKSGRNVPRLRFISGRSLETQPTDIVAALA